MAIDLQNIDKRFGTQKVLKGISLQVAAGESYAILGQSGTGKSTLLKIIAGLVHPDSGTLKVESSSIGMLFQKNALFDSLTVIENLDFTLKESTLMPPKQRKELSLQYLDWVGLAGKEDLYPGELSGGMQKRMGMARALILKPEIILYDEPTAGLDPITSKHIAELMLRLHHELNSTMITITSDVLRAFQLANKIGLLVRTPEGSELKNIGTPEQARASTDPYVDQFIHGKIHGPLTENLGPKKL
jgi:phospholipid/cholesterol/gamma-HCH transport system ATP-binding protein